MQFDALTSFAGYFLGCFGGEKKMFLISSLKSALSERSRLIFPWTDNLVFCLPWYFIFQCEKLLISDKGGHRAGAQHILKWHLTATEDFEKNLLIRFVEMWGLVSYKAVRPDKEQGEYLVLSSLAFIMFEDDILSIIIIEKDVRREKKKSVSKRGVRGGLTRWS